MDRFIDVVFAYHNPRARIAASLTEHVKRAHAVFKPLTAPGSDTLNVIQKLTTTRLYFL